MVRKRVHAITGAFCGMIADEHDRRCLRNHAGVRGPGCSVIDIMAARSYLGTLCVQSSNLWRSGLACPDAPIYMQAARRVRACSVFLLCTAVSPHRPSPSHLRCACTEAVLLKHCKLRVSASASSMQYRFVHVHARLFPGDEYSARANYRDAREPDGLQVWQATRARWPAGASSNPYVICSSRKRRNKSARYSSNT
jgi:hypothetical protein